MCGCSEVLECMVHVCLQLVGDLEVSGNLVHQSILLSLQQLRTKGTHRREEKGGPRAHTEGKRRVDQGHTQKEREGWTKHSAHAGEHCL